jgi:hypothetical protein
VCLVWDSAVVLSSVEVAGLACEVAVDRNLARVGVWHVEEVTGLLQVLDGLLHYIYLTIHLPADTGHNHTRPALNTLHAIWQ